MVNYIKEYEVLGRRYGIEDFKSPGEHFFNGKDSNGKRRPRFMLWAGGCGIEGAKTLDEANDNLFIHIYEEVSKKLRDTDLTFQECQRTVNILGCANNLAHFKINRKGKQK